MKNLLYSAILKATKNLYAVYLNNVMNKLKHLKQCRYTVIKTYIDTVTRFIVLFKYSAVINKKILRVNQLKKFKTPTLMFL